VKGYLKIVSFSFLSPGIGDTGEKMKQGKDANAKPGHQVRTASLGG